MKMCVTLTTRQLKAPSTARFAPYDDWHIKQTTGVTYRLIAWVDAQNSFGAQVRQSFVAYVSYTGGRNFRLDSIEFLEWEDSNTLAKIADICEKIQANKAAKQELEKMKSSDNDDSGVVYLKKPRVTPYEFTSQDRADIQDRIAQKARDDIDAAALKAQKLEEERVKKEEFDRLYRSQQDMFKEARDAEAAAEEAKYHKWTSASGKFTLDAKIIRYANGVVTLLGRDNVEKKVDRTKLSADDQKVIDKWIAGKR